MIIIFHEFLNVAAIQAQAPFNVVLVIVFPLATMQSAAASDAAASVMLPVYRRWRRLLYSMFLWFQAQAEFAGGGLFCRLFKEDYPCLYDRYQIVKKSLQR